MTFLQKYELLKKSIPVPAVSVGQRTENCDLVDMTYASKNCYYCFDCFGLEDSIYCKTSMGKNLVDCSYCVECELCYECLDCNNCYNSTYLWDCNNCTDCHFSALCIACSDCFGCVGLTHKKYCIFNKQYTEEEYFREIEKLKRENPRKLFERMLELKGEIPHPASRQYNNENCLYGDYLYNSKNVFWGFNTYKLENCGYIFLGGFNVKDCWDMYFAGDGAELCYEITDASRIYNCAYLFGSSDCTNCYYSSDLLNCSDCWGCAGLSNKKYCILNNQLTKEQYEKAVIEIKKELRWKFTTIATPQ